VTTGCSKSPAERTCRRDRLVQRGSIEQLPASIGIRAGGVEVARGFDDALGQRPRVVLTERAPVGVSLFVGLGLRIAHWREPFGLCTFVILAEALLRNSLAIV